MKEYFYAKNGEQFGPFTIDELMAEKISRDTLVWKQGLTNWEKAEMLEEINKFFAITPPPLNYEKINFPPPLQEENIEKNKKSKFTLYLLVGIIAISSVVLFFIFNNQSSNNYSQDVSNNSYEIPARELTAEELQAELKNKELARPLDFITVDYSVRTNLIGQDIVEGTIYNSATNATFKDVTLKITFKTESETVVGTQDKIIYDFLSPNSKKYFKYKLSSPAYTKYIGVSIRKAKPVRDR